MSALRRKLLRDLLHMKSQMGAVALVVLCGIASFVTMWCMYDFLRGSQESYYREYRFADVFARLERAPARVGSEIEAIPGVAEVRARVVHDVVLDVPGLVEPATGRLLSIPDRRRPVLNDVHIRRGRYPSPERDDEVLASEGFADANGLGPGDVVGGVVNDRWRRLRIVGIAISPEYVYEVRGVELHGVGDRRRFGVLWMPRSVLAAALDLEGAFNDVALDLEPAASEPEVIARLDRVLDRYGGLGAHGRDQQLSHRFLSDEIGQNRVTLTIVPTIFLAVAAFLLHLIVSRLVELQRDQIGVLKAFGYRNAAVGRHYLEMAMVPVLAGAAAGIALGLWLAGLLAGVYADFYHFPEVGYAPRPSVVALALGVAIVAAAVGAVAAVRRTVRLPPAEAMRPAAPPRFRPGPAERLGVGRLLSTVGRMVLRNVERQPAKALLSLLGIALAVAVVVVGRYFFDAVDVLKDIAFREAQRDDVSVVFLEPLPVSARHALENLPGVSLAEPFRSVAVRARNGHRSRRTAVLGLPADGTLHRIVDREHRVWPVPPEGLLVSRKLAEILDVKRGDPVRLEVLEGTKPIREVRVAGVVDELVGLGLYMERKSLSRLAGEAERASGAFLSVDPASRDELYRRLKRTPAVTGVSVREASLRAFEETFAESFGIATTTLILFAGVIAFGIVYNGARVALSERGRELASLRVLGFTRREVAGMLLGEQAFLTLVALPVGCLLGLGLCVFIVRAMDSEVYRLPLAVSRYSYGFALAVVLGSAAVSAWIVRRRIDRLDLVAVLKTRE